jgi:hypothetical protein
MANAIASCKYAINYISIDIPFIISGQSISSAGGQGAQGQHFGEISKIKQLPKDTAAVWTPEIPYYWSGYTIYSESVIKSLKRMNMSEYLKEFNYEYLYAACLVFDTNYKERVNNVIKQQNYCFLGFKRSKILYYIIVIWIKRIFLHLKNNLVLVLPDFLNRKNTIFHQKNILEVAIINDGLIERKSKGKSEILI